MVYNIVYDAVKKKAQTETANILIGNVEMAAGMGIVLKEINRKMDFEGINEPIQIKERFESMIKDVGEISELSKTIIELINKYQVKEMVNETMEDLKVLVMEYDKI